MKPCPLLSSEDQISMYHTRTILDSRHQLSLINNIPLHPSTRKRRGSIIYATVPCMYRCFLNKAMLDYNLPACQCRCNKQAISTLPAVCTSTPAECASDIANPASPMNPFPRLSWPFPVQRSVKKLARIHPKRSPHGADMINQSCSRRYTGPQVLCFLCFLPRPAGNCQVLTRRRLRNGDIIRGSRDGDLGAGKAMAGAGFRRSGAVCQC